MWLGRLWLPPSPCGASSATRALGSGRMRPGRLSGRSAAEAVAEEKAVAGDEQKRTRMSAERRCTRVQQPKVRRSRSTRAGWQSGARAMPRHLAMELAVQKCKPMRAGTPWAWCGVLRGKATSAAAWAQRAACGRRQCPRAPASHLTHCMASPKLTETGKLLPQRLPLSRHSMGSASDDAAVLADLAQLKLDEVRCASCCMWRRPLSCLALCGRLPSSPARTPATAGGRAGSSGAVPEGAKGAAAAGRAAGSRGRRGGGSGRRSRQLGRWGAAEGWI